MDFTAENGQVNVQMVGLSDGSISIKIFSDRKTAVRSMLETYKDFGGIRIEDDLLITADGCRFLGKNRIPYHPDEVEDFIEKNRE